MGIGAGAVVFCELWATAIICQFTGHSFTVHIFLADGAEVVVEDGLEAVDAGAALLHLRDGGGEFFGWGYHEDEHHDVRHKEFGREGAVASQHHAGAEEEDADDHTVAEEIADGRGEVDASQHAGAQAGILGVGFLKTTVGEVDGGVGFHHLEAYNGLLHEGGEEGAKVLQLARAAPQTMAEAGDDEDDDGHHAEHEEGEACADVEQHDEVEHDADDGGEELLEGGQHALVVLHYVASEAGQDVAFADGAEIGERQMEHLVEQAAADVAHHLAPHYRHLHRSEVAKDILESVKPQQHYGEIDQGTLGAEGGQPLIEGSQPLREQAGRGRRHDGGTFGRGEENLEEVGHREGCGHGEEHREHHKEPIGHQSGSVGAHVVEGEALHAN